jgi:hypothetical protein
MNPLESQTQPLFAKSELGRVQMRGDLAELTASLRFFQCGKTGEIHPMFSWLQAILIGAGLIFALWLALRSQGRHLNEIQYIKTIGRETPHNKSLPYYVK